MAKIRRWEVNRFCTGYEQGDELCRDCDMHGVREIKTRSTEEPHLTPYINKRCPSGRKTRGHDGKLRPVYVSIEFSDFRRA
jgi:hypothetical protein